MVQVLTVDDEPSPLFPVIGNIHEFKAVTDTAVLDILSPPYAPSKSEYLPHCWSPCLTACTVCVVVSTQVPDHGCDCTDRDCSYYEVLPITESATLAAGAADVPRDPTTVLLEVSTSLCMCPAANTFDRVNTASAKPISTAHVNIA